MKRNRNFLLIVWAASLLGLSAVRTVHAAGAAGFYIPDKLSVYETQKDSVEGMSNPYDEVSALLVPDEFDAEKHGYDDLNASFKSRILFLAFQWKLAVPGGTSADSAKVKVVVNGEEIQKYQRGTKDQSKKLLDYAGDWVYMIPFGPSIDSVNGWVEVDLGGGNKLTYTATIRRKDADNITALKRIWIRDLCDAAVAAKKDTIFRVTPSEEENNMLKGRDYGEVSLKNLDKGTDDNQGWGRADTLYFQKFDQLSMIYVIKNDKDTIDASGTASNGTNGTSGDTCYNKVKYTHITDQIYKVKIEAGNKYTIAVTARDSLTRDFYHVTLLADTLVPALPENGTPFDSLRYMLKDVYLYEGEQDNPTLRYTLRDKSHGIPGFRDTLRDYRVTAPWSSVKVGYDYWNKNEFDNAKKTIVILKYETDNKERFIEVRVKVPETDKNIAGRGSNDTTYVIRVLSGNNQLEGLRLSYDMYGKEPIELIRDNVKDEYTSAAVDYSVRTVYVWAATEDDRAKVKDGNNEWNKVDSTGEYYQMLSLEKYDKGGQQTFPFLVWAEDTASQKGYKVTVKTKWNPTPESITFKWANQKDKEGLFEKEKLNENNVFDIKIPGNLAIEDVEVKVADMDKNYFRVFQTFSEKDTQDGKLYSYIIKVTAKEDGATKAYTFNLFHPSSDATLSYLAVQGFELSPAFAPNHADYTIIVPREQTTVNFIAVANRRDATIAGDREHTLHGDSTFAIVVTAEDGTKKTYNVTVTSNTNTGIQLVDGSSVQVYVSNQSLHVSTPAAERVSVYSAGGQLLYSLNKPTGKAFVSTFPKGVLIVKGSSGWVKKVALH
jgi:hypothetical protein